MPVLWGRVGGRVQDRLWISDGVCQNRRIAGSQDRRITMAEPDNVVPANDDAFLYSSEWERSLCKILIHIWDTPSPFWLFYCCCCLRSCSGRGHKLCRRRISLQDCNRLSIAHFRQFPWLKQWIWFELPACWPVSRLWRIPIQDRPSVPRPLEWIRDVSPASAGETRRKWSRPAKELYLKSRGRLLCKWDANEMQMRCKSSRKLAAESWPTPPRLAAAARPTPIKSNRIKKTEKYNQFN